jgi:carbamate kinase
VRILVALGGNAMTAPDGSAGPDDQIAAAKVAMDGVARLVAEGVDVLLTHGNGPQVGNLLVKNELAAHVVPPVPLDWCGAQTQATLGFILTSALEASLADRNSRRPVAALVTRTLVDRDDPGFANPTKPIGRYLTADEAAVLVEHGQHFQDRGERGWRRVVASPEPLEILDAPAIEALMAAGYIVVAAGGGGIPMVREVDGELHGVEAVIDKDLAAARLGRTLGVDGLVIATDIDHAILGFGTEHARPLGRVTVAEMRRHAADGEFASGSMGPKVEAVCRFVEQSGRSGVITSLGNIVAGVREESGTIVVPDDAGASHADALDTTAADATAAADDNAPGPPT